MSGRVKTTGERELVTFSFAGREVTAWRGDSIAMALFAAGESTLRRSSREGQPRGVLCNMGICYECLVVVDGANVRACTTLVENGMQVERGGRS